MNFLSKRRKMIIGIAGALCCAAAMGAFILYQRIYAVNLQCADDSYLYLPANCTFEQVRDSLVAHGLQDTASFRWTAAKMHYTGRMKAGRYRLQPKMSNIELVRLLRAGRQIPVKVTFTNIRSGAQLAGAVAPNIEADSSSIAALFSDSAFLARHGLTPATALSVFVPNTYELLWNTSAEGFWERMIKEHRRFWNAERLKKARDMDMTPLQVTILASIIEEETQINSDRLMIAGVYVNRLRKGMALQACPTLKFALGDFSLRRVLTKHMQTPSPYNTYIHTGLPPGPICAPSIASIDAVLNYTRHKYLYFCAKADFSGYHNFSNTLTQHNRYAQQYQRELNKRQIYH